ncbi:TonB-dependent receptor [Gaoshiqia sediminis]|uniref:TonB-dependent receptor n=1 Tax=Gaoshiqia sediminis TaxID=2986998 RepID=A0AA41YBN1_9BACT|nr:TonB-dependent receptor [Gaoshiqia sediminis]MCW0483115.1 TonB-dependent receptor [Gaoshiqia sediminis]
MATLKLLNIREKLIRVTLTLIVVMTIGDLAHGQSERSSISGVIRSNTGESLPGVNVLLVHQQKGTATDIDGSFGFRELLPGSYLLQTSCMGFEPAHKEIELQAGQELKVELHLQEETYTLNDVVVNGKSATRRVIEQAYQVASVSTKELFNSTADAKAVINRISGVRIQEDGGLGSDINFTLNGFSGDQVKFFMDGIPMDNFGSSLGLSDLPVNLIERIDVYKGVVPVWLGTDALGGAVNIITNRNPAYFDASYSIGSFHTHRASVNGAWTNPQNGFTFRANAFLNYSDNDYKVLAEIVRNNVIVDTAEVRRFHDRYRSGTVKIETGVVNKTYADNLLFGLIASASDKQVQHGATMSTVYGGIMRNSQSLIPNLRFNKKNLFTDGLDVSLYSAFSLNESQVTDTLRGVRYNWLGEATVTTTGDGEVSNDGEYFRTFTTLDEKEWTNQLNVGYALSTRSSLALNYAFSYFHRKAFDAENPELADSKFPKSLTKNVLGLAYKFDFNGRWSMTAFGKTFLTRAKTSKEFDFALETQRVEAVKNYQHNVGYGLASTYFILPELQVKASYEHSSRMPMPEEIFGDGLFIDANPDLGPEQSDNFNLGAEYRFRMKASEFALGSSFIYREADDLIYTVVTIASPKTRYDNLNKTRVLGVEGNFLYRYQEWFRLGGNVTFQDITDQAAFIRNDSYTGSGWQKNYHYGYRLPNKPYFFGSVNAGLSFARVGAPSSSLNLNYFFNFVEKYFLTWTEMGSSNNNYVIPRQTTHDLEVSYSIQNGKYNISAECRNMLDARVYDKYYLQKPGRSFAVKLRYTL